MKNKGRQLNVFVIGEVDDPIPATGEVRIRVKASGINPGDIKKREMHSAMECLIRGSSRTATVQAWSIAWAKALHLNGWANASGVLAPNLTGLLAPPQSTR